MEYCERKINLQCSMNYVKYSDCFVIKMCDNGFSIDILYWPTTSMNLKLHEKDNIAGANAEQILQYSHACEDFFL